MCFLFGRKKVYENGYRKYTIKKGTHRSTFSYKKFKGNSLVFDAIFDSTAIYTSQKDENQYDINKLFGVSTCGDRHMENSIRFGWRWINGNLEIHWFKHEDGEFDFAKIMNVELDRSYTYEIYLHDNYYFLSIGNETIQLDKDCKGKGNNYFLYPYFGGNEEAPHDIDILIKVNK